MSSTGNKHTRPTYTWADMSWVMAISPSDHEAVVAQRASVAVEETLGVAREETMA